MMTRLMGLKEAFREDKKVRVRVYLAALVLNVINVAAAMMISEECGPLACLLFAATVAATLGFYYVSDGIRTFLVIVNQVSKIGEVIGGILALGVAWALGIGAFFSFLMSIVARIGCFFYGAALAYLLPVVFVPLLHWIGVTFHF
ncbi:MAG: hypothetical protein LUE86_08560, partial [Clostridiales bacterium]|nr:hypothetical protein [Clostridiales bacterium]